MIEVVDVDRPGGHVGDVDRHAPEPQTPRLVRQPDQVVLDADAVLGPCGTDMHRAAVAQYDVGLSMGRVSAPTVSGSLIAEAKGTPSKPERSSQTVRVNARDRGRLA